MGFTLAKPQESCSINDRQFFVDPLEEFDVLTSLESQHGDDISARDSAYGQRLLQNHGLAISLPQVRAFIEWIIQYTQDFLAKSKKKPPEPAGSPTGTSLTPVD
jgi:hypothetical protein